MFKLIEALNKTNTYIDIKNLLNKKELYELHNLKNYCDEIYYNSEDKDLDILKDEIYDILVEIISNRETPNYIFPIGTKITTDKEVKLPCFLGSMNKLKSDNDINKWITKHKDDFYLVEDKLDGVSCLLIIDNFDIKLYTRGDGEFGSDISYLSPYIKNIPKKINSGDSLRIRGELIMKKEIFEKKYSKTFANPRNLVSGIVNSKTIKEESKDIEFVAYEIINKENLTVLDQLNILKTNNFLVVNHTILPNIDVEILTEKLLEFKKSSDYEIDGIIIHSNKKYKRNTSGNPEYAFAFKVRMDDNIAETMVEEVEWNHTKWNVLKPRIRVKPVNLCGVSITYATGFNAKYILENNLGKGSIVLITRSNDVIPFIVEVKKSTTAEFPEEEYKWNETKVDIIAESDDNSISKIKQIASFFSDLKIKYVSVSTIERMFESGYDTLPKILSASIKDFEKIDRFGEKMAERTYNNIHEGLTNINIPLLLGSASCFGFGIGKRKVKKLFEEIPDLLELYNIKTSNELEKMILNVEGFSDLSANKIIENIPNAKMFIDSILPYVTLTKTEENNQHFSNNLEGQKIVMSGFRDSELSTNIEKRQGSIMSSVSKNTTILIVKDSSKETSKILQAKSLGISIYSKDEFMKKYI
jgi:NAD-dependent DNA ligase